MIDYRVYTFLEVCKTMNYTKASEALNITQPNVTQHIRWLEGEYGQKLFEYKRRKLSLTPAGELLKNTAAAMVHEDKILHRRMDAASRDTSGFSFGITRSINESTMKNNVMALLRENTGKNIHFCVDDTKNLLAKLDDMTLDFALVEGNFDKNKYDFVVLSKEDFIVVCSPSLALSKAPLRLEHLSGLPLIIRESGSGSREILESILKSRNYTYDNFSSVMEIGDMAAIKEFAADGRGITFIYETAVRRELDAGRLIKLPLEDLHITHDFCMVWLKTGQFRSSFEALAARLLP